MKKLLRLCAILLVVVLAGCTRWSRGATPPTSLAPTPMPSVATSPLPHLTATVASQTTNAPSPQTSQEAKTDEVVVKDSKYGFNFTLPASWTGYTIITDKWESIPSAKKPVKTGPLLSIRHPQWTKDHPRQDIPMFVFTLAQWDALQKDEFHIGAAPMGPSELGRNSRYVFALPARYNYAFPTGYEEVETILSGHPLQPTETFDQ